MPKKADFETLRQLLAESYPLEAAKVAVLGWQRFGRPAALLQALNLYAGQQQWRQWGLC